MPTNTSITSLIDLSAPAESVESIVARGDITHDEAVAINDYCCSLDATSENLIGVYDFMFAAAENISSATMNIVRLVPHGTYYPEIERSTTMWLKEGTPAGYSRREWVYKLLELIKMSMAQLIKYSE